MSITDLGGIVCPDRVLQLISDKEAQDGRDVDDDVIRTTNDVITVTVALLDPTQHFVAAEQDTVEVDVQTLAPVARVAHDAGVVDQ